MFVAAPALAAIQDVVSAAGPVQAQPPLLIYTFEDERTAADNSPAVSVSSGGPIIVRGGKATTTGADSDGVLVQGEYGLVRVDVEAVSTAGPASDGIRVVTTGGPQNIVAGPVHVTGPGSNGISALSTACGIIAITARDDITATAGIAIVARNACDVNVTTLPGAAVSGATAGIHVTSGTGANISIGDTVSSTAGPAIDADVGRANVLIAATGSVTGVVDLTDANDTLDNAGTFAPTGATSFGAGTDLLLNRGRLRVAQSVTLAGLESLVNTGTIDLVDGAVDDVLTIPGTFTGGTGSTLAVDLASGTAGTPTDRLVIGGAVSGTTAVRLNLVGTGPAVINPTGTLIVDSASAAAGAYTLAQPASSGFVDYSLGQNATGDLLVFALPNAVAVEPMLLPQLAQSFWYSSADAFTQSQTFRDGAGFWSQGYGGSEKRGDRRDVDLFGVPTDTNLRYKTDRLGLQAGYGFGDGGDTSFGVTGGYQWGNTDFASATEADFDGFNVGAYLVHAPASGLTFQLLGKIDFFNIDLDNGTTFDGADIDAKSYGAEGEVGYRIASSAVNFDLSAGLAYVRTDLDDFDASGASFSYDTAESLRGRLGVRVSGTGAGIAPFADVRVYHELAGDNAARLSSGGFVLPLADSFGTSVRGEVGLSGNAGFGGLHLSAWGEAGDVRGYGLRLGIRF